jgi:4-hydroxymandelate oxidase
VIHQPVFAGLRSVSDYEKRCRELISEEEFEILYGDHGHPNWSTYTSNRAAFHAVKLRPRVLAGVERRDLSTTLLGQEVSFPVVVGPTGYHGTMHADAESVTARAAGARGAALVLSSTTTQALPDIAPAISGPWWKQLFLYKDRGINRYEIAQAESYRCGAYVLTVSNVAYIGHHQRPIGRVGNDPSSWMAHLTGYDGAFPETFVEAVDASVSWRDVDWLRSQIDRPLVIKGIQTAEDARLCVEHGAAALVISNHGGRYLQGATGTLEALPEVVDAVDGRVEVHVDGGVRQGQDVLKALALGAKAVWIGRAARWGLTVGGAEGVRDVLDILYSELDGSMALCGVADVRHVDPALISTSSFASIEN